MTKKLNIFLGLIVGVLATICFSVVSAEWLEPTGNPPSNNTEAPITESLLTQSKKGSLMVASNSGTPVVFSQGKMCFVKSSADTTCADPQAWIFAPADNTGKIRIGGNMSGDNPEIQLQYSAEDSNDHWGIYVNQSDTALRFWRGNDLMTILPNGNVGIGIDNPKQKLSVNGSILLSNSAQNRSISIDYQDNNQGSNLSIRAGDSNNPNMYPSLSGGSLLLDGGSGGVAGGGGDVVINGGEGAAGAGPSGNILLGQTYGNVGIGNTTNTTFNKLSVGDSSSGPIIGLLGLTNVYRGLVVYNLSSNEQWFSGANDSNNFVIRNGGATDNLTINKSTGNLTLSGQIKISGGNPGNNKVLTSDANGLASWQTISGAGGNSGGTPGGGVGAIQFKEQNNSFGGTNNLNWSEDENTLFLRGGFTYIDGNQGAGKVLVSNDGGAASWQSLPTGSTSFWAQVASGINYGLGNVGIGSGAPDQKLDVAGNIRLGDSSGGHLIFNGTENGVIDWGAAGNLYFRTNASLGNPNAFSEIMTILGNGNVGIGTTGPNAKLQVNGQIKIVDGSQGAGKVLTSDANGLASWQTVAVATNDCIVLPSGLTPPTGYTISSGHVTGLTRKSSIDQCIDVMTCDVGNSTCNNDSGSQEYTVGKWLNNAPSDCLWYRCLTNSGICSNPNDGDVIGYTPTYDYKQYCK